MTTTIPTEPGPNATPAEHHSFTAACNRSTAASRRSYLDFSTDESERQWAADTANAYELLAAAEQAYADALAADGGVGMTTSRDVRDAEFIARQHAISLDHNAPPPALDLIGHRHATRLASLWREIATVHAEYAQDLDALNRPGAA